MLISLGASFSMKSVYIFLAFEDSFWGDLVFLKSSQASQNSIFSSQNSDFKKALNAARPSVGREEKKKSIQNVKNGMTKIIADAFLVLQFPRFHSDL